MTTQHNAVMTDDQVLFMRREIRKNKKMDIRGWAQKYNVSHPTVLAAIRGKTFKHVPEPITETFHAPQLGRKCVLTDEQLQSLHELRKRDPHVWTFRALAERSNKLFDTNYHPMNIKRLIERRFGAVEKPALIRAPSEKVQRIRAPRPKIERVKVVQPKTPKVVAKPVEPRVVHIPRNMRVVDLSDVNARRSIAERLMAMRS